MSNPVTGVTPEDSTSGEFGANEWLVDEMYERYLVDKESVDKSWWPILESYRPVDDPTPTSAIPVVTSPDAAPAASAPAPAAESAPPADAVAPKSQVGGEAQVPEAVTASAPASPAPESAPPTTPVARTTSAPAKPQPIPAQAPTTASNPVVAETAEPQETVTVLKGMAKTLSTNMDQSLTVPTATSVRTIPAKLMIDNRIVINNHLRRARGGKVSFTHLIAWAMVQTLKEFPSQAVFYRETEDGKPSVVAPAHINL
ncbi:MAG TPA: 2-oxo acid dehydrogenase subunit E2, partial [Protaetiibacter sp.]|nr:2-oxo acid dehydrogenase subunit E2 [Protaetiibacter sp.]